MPSFLSNMTDDPADIARDVAAVQRISAVPQLLRVICQITGMGFAAVARVTGNSWTACAVQDDIGFGLKPGGALEARTTLCVESRAARRPIVIDHASVDEVYRNHHTPRTYKIESYISVPIVLPNDDYFGNLCAIDPKPARVSQDRVVSMFTLFAELVAVQLQAERRHDDAADALADERKVADLREQFIAVLGHDLRNPLGVLSSNAHLLARRDEPDLVRIGQRMQAAALRMSKLIEDVMDFARGRMGSGLDVTRAPVADLPAALREVVAELADTHPGRPVDAKIVVEGTVLCDRARLQQLLSNLLGNAYTHGAPDRPVTVEARREEDHLVLIVGNEGQPIAPEDLPRIFQPYWRPANSPHKGGLGLGLYICAEIVKAHGGTLTVTSSAHAGTRFITKLPLDAPR